MRQRTFIALAVVAMATAACGGGGGGGSTGADSSALPGTVSVPGAQATAASTAAPANYLKASFSITVPKATSPSAFSRRALTISASTQSIAFTLLQQNGASVPGSAAQIFPLTATSPGCSTNALGLTCTLQINAPIGPDVYLAQTYTGTDGTGTLTGSGAVKLAVAQNATNTATLSLTGQVASIYLAATNAYLGSSNLTSAARRVPAAGTVNALQIFVIALDSSNNVILNPSVYNTPISLQLIYPYGGAPDVSLQVQPGTEGGGLSYTTSNYGSVAVNSPSDVITANIVPNVANGASQAVIVGNIGSALLPSPAPSASPSALPSPLPAGAAMLRFPVVEPTSSVPSGQILLYDYGVGNDVTSLNALGLTTDEQSVTEAGFTGNFTLSDPGCAGIISLSLTNYGGDAYMYATATAVGTCTAVISDGLGNTLTVPVTVETTSVTGS